VGPLGLEPRTS